MKKLIIFLLFLSLLCCSVFASDITPTATASNYGIFDRLADNIFGAKYISGGTLSSSTIEKGQILTANLNLRFTQDASGTGYGSKNYHYKLTLYFTNDAFTKDKKIGEFYFASPQKKGDWINIAVKNLDTGILDSSYCADTLKVKGKHEVYVNGEWIEDKMGSITFSSNNGASYKTDSNVKLTCATVPNPCTRKLLETKCGSNGVPMQVWQNGLQVDGICKKDNTYLNPCRSTESCIAGACVATTTCNSGDWKCDLNGLYSVPCINGNYVNTIGTGKAEICANGCEDSTGRCLEGGEPETGNLGCTVNTDCTSDYVCNNGVCDKKPTTINNTITGSCVSSKDCKTGEMCDYTTTATGNGVCVADTYDLGDVIPPKANETKLNEIITQIGDFISENYNKLAGTPQGKTIFWVVVVLLVVIAYLYFKMRKKRK